MPTAQEFMDTNFGRSHSNKHNEVVKWYDEVEKMLGGLIKQSQDLPPTTKRGG